MAALSSRYTYEGTDSTETSITRTSGFVDPTGQAQSRKLVTTANAQWLRPFKAEHYSVWNPTAGADVTVTLYGVVNSGALPNNDDIWMDVEYLAGSLVPFDIDGTVTHATGGTGTTSSGLTLPNTTYANDILVLFSCHNGSGALTISSITDSSGKTATWQMRRIVPASAFFLEEWYTTTTGAITGSPSVTIHYNGSTTYQSLAVFAISGANTSSPFDTNVSLPAAANSTPSDPLSCNTTASNTIAIAGFRMNTTPTPTAGSGWTQDIGADYLLVEHKINISPQTGLSATIGTGSGNSNGSILDAIVKGSSVSVAATLGKIVTTTKSNLLAANAAVASDSSTWNNAVTSALATWDASTATNVTLSGGNLVATNTATTSADQGVRTASALALNNGKFYFEVTFTTSTGGGNRAAGICTTGSTYTNLGANSTSGNLVFFSSGSVYQSGSSTGFVLGAISAGDVIGIAVDLDNRKSWFRKGSAGLWNGNATHDPATSAFGIPIPAGDMVPFVIFGGGSGLANNVMTANFGASAFTGAVPSGFFSGWKSIWSPFKLTTTLNSPQPGLAGYLDARIRVGKPSATFYIDPQITLTPGSGGTTNAATAYTSSRYAYEGTESTETAITRTGGAVDPTGQKQSRKIVTTANSQWLRPFKAEPYAVWSNVTGANVTVTVCGVVNSGALPNNDDIWMDVEYLTLDVPAVTFDPGTTAETTLSNSNLTATRTAQVQIYGGARNTNYKSTGKYYYEFTAGVVSSSGWTLAKSTATYQEIASDGTNVMLVTPGGLIYSNNTISGKSIASISVGNVIGFAVDIGAGLGWVRKIVGGTPGNWNGDALANPATGVGGVPLAAGNYSPAVGFGSGSAAAGANSTLNVGASSYASAAPSGFGNWPALSGLLGKIVTSTKSNVLAASSAVASDGSVWSTPHTTLDGASSNLTLSNGNLTVQRPAISAGGAVSSAFLPGGKYYFEAKTTGQVTSQNAFGLMMAGGIVTTNPAIAATHVVVSGGATSTIYLNGVSSGKTLGTYAVGDVFAVAVDLTASLIWIRRNTGNWNNDATANPATGTGGLSFTTGVYAPLVYLTANSNTSDIVTANFGQSTYLGTPPSGFLSWDTGWVPFKLTTTLNSPQPGQAGYIHTRVRAAKPSATFYIDPQINLS